MLSVQCQHNLEVKLLLSSHGAMSIVKQSMVNDDTSSEKYSPRRSPSQRLKTAYTAMVMPTLLILAT